MTEGQQALFALAEALGKFVWEVEQMPAHEFFGWHAYYEEKDRQRRAEKGDVTAMDEDQMIRHLTGGS